ncbi:uncharacterized protein NEMAJ01_2046 [Nematocida major]|uniref:uncharacterized protein n=1 Tax=Nematocida major TaxID=1912982 RepID=UPI002008195C|nr:uncharacterized protein NEMAJ01_2046 [Nematocida major]KAH9387150.1 hypothetical protein NEMAJ01_2046 [Nematocida major]
MRKFIFGFLAAAVASCSHEMPLDYFRKELQIRKKELGIARMSLVKNTEENTCIKYDIDRCCTMIADVEKLCKEKNASESILIRDCMSIMDDAYSIKLQLREKCVASETTAIQLPHKIWYFDNGSAKSRTVKEMPSMELDLYVLAREKYLVAMRLADIFEQADEEKMADEEAFAAIICGRIPAIDSLETARRFITSVRANVSMMKFSIMEAVSNNLHSLLPVKEEAEYKRMLLWYIIKACSKDTAAPLNLTQEEAEDMLKANGIYNASMSSLVEITPRVGYISTQDPSLFRPKDFIDILTAEHFLNNGRFVGAGKVLKTLHRQVMRSSKPVLEYIAHMVGAIMTNIDVASKDENPNYSARKTQARNASCENMLACRLCKKSRDIMNFYTKDPRRMALHVLDELANVVYIDEDGTGALRPYISNYHFVWHAVKVLNAKFCKETRTFVPEPTEKRAHNPPMDIVALNKIMHEGNVFFSLDSKAVLIGRQA